jgi:hypothetical protein
LQEVQEGFAQEPQPELAVPAKGFSTPLIPKTESSFSTSDEAQDGHSTAGEPKTSFSNFAPQALHLYSNIGMDIVYHSPRGLRSEAHPV